MLVLTRKPGEKVRIAGNIFVEVVEVDGKRVRIGFTAPPDVPIVREELIEENEQGDDETLYFHI